MKRILLLLIACSFTAITYSQSTFSVTKNGTTAAMDSAIDFTTNIWSQYLNSSVPIKININYSNLSSFGPLAITFSNGEKDFVGTPISDVWYATCLANSITSTELNPGEFDIDINVNSATNYYFGTDGNPGPGQHDFVSVLLHEIVHGLGGTSLSKYEAGIGSFGMLTLSDFIGFQLSFPFPDLVGRPSVWDNFLMNGNGQLIADTNLFTNSSTALGTEFQSNNIYFSGPIATAQNGGNQPRMFAPSPYENGSSLHHFNEASFPNSSGDGMFTPYSAINEVQHTPGPLLLAALTDIGWNLNLDVGIESMELTVFKVYPNPSRGIVNIDLDGKSFDLQIIDLLGNVVIENVKSGVNDFGSLQPGTYFISGKLDKQTINQRFTIID